MHGEHFQQFLQPDNLLRSDSFERVAWFHNELGLFHDLAVVENRMIGHDYRAIGLFRQMEVFGCQTLSFQFQRTFDLVTSAADNPISSRPKCQRRKAKLE